jgi:hypothetical protein
MMAASLALLTVLVASGLGWPGADSAAQETGRVEGEPVTCPGGESVTSAFELNGSQFSVVGVLAAIEGRAAIITGPTGDVPFVLSDNAAVSSGLVVGEPAGASGTLDDLGVYTADTLTALCAGGAMPTPAPTPTPAPETEMPGPTESPSPSATPGAAPGEAAMRQCNRGPGHAGDLRLEVKDGEVKIKRGTVLAFMDGTLTVDAPGGPIPVLITSDTEVKGDLSIAAEVRLEGTLDEDGAVVAEKARALCPGEVDGEAGDDDADDDDEADDVDDNSGDHDDDGMDGAAQHMRATPAVPATPAIPGERGNPATPAVPAIPAVPPHDGDHDNNGHDGDHDNNGHDGDHDNNGHDGGHGNDSRGNDD